MRYVLGNLLLLALGIGVPALWLAFRFRWRECEGPEYDGIVVCSEPLVAPLSGTACVHWRVSVDGADVDDLRTLGAWQEGASFEVQNTSGNVSIQRCATWRNPKRLRQRIIFGADASDRHLEFLARCEGDISASKYHITEECIPVGQEVRMCCEPDAGASLQWRGAIVSPRRAWASRTARRQAGRGRPP